MRFVIRNYNKSKLLNCYVSAAVEKTYSPRNRDQEPRWKPEKNGLKGKWNLEI